MNVISHRNHRPEWQIFFAFSKVDYIEKVQRMGEDRNFPHDAAEKDFGYRPISFKKGIKIEVEQYLKTFRS